MYANLYNLSTILMHVSTTMRNTLTTGLESRSDKSRSAHCTGDFIALNQPQIANSLNLTVLSDFLNYLFIRDSLVSGLIMAFEVLPPTKHVKGLCHNEE